MIKHLDISFSFMRKGIRRREAAPIRKGSVLRSLTLLGCYLMAESKKRGQMPSLFILCIKEITDLFVNAVSVQIVLLDLSLQCRTFR